MLGDVAGWVGFDEQIEVAVVFVRGDGCVGAYDFFGLVGDRGGDGHVLADWKAEDVRWAREGEAVAAACQNMFRGKKVGSIWVRLHGDIVRKYGFFL